jgi:transcriptional regulator with XRE-family HTH domain
MLVAKGQRVAESSPTVRQRELGIRLRELRNRHGMTVDEVAEKLLCSATKVSRAETGARRPSLRDVRDLCVLYDVSSEETAELMELAREARQQGWWTPYTDLRISQLIGLEQEATTITCFGMYFVPALLQTEEYANSIIKGILPKINPDILRQRVEARMRRQQLLQQPKPPRYRALLDEAVLRRHVGGRATMHAQLGKMLQFIREEKVTIQIIPFEVGSYAAMDSNFDYLEFGDSSLPDIVFVEGLDSQIYHERRDDVAQYTESLEYLRDAAFSPRDSVSRIAEIRDEHAGSQDEQVGS